jgi:hypothetical protein
MVRTTTTRAMTPSGRLSRKIQRHEARSVSVPPRSGPGGGRPHGADEALVAPALAGGEEVRDRRLRQRQQATGADALQGPKGHELAHGLGEGAQHRGGDEDRDREDEQPSAPVEI